MIKGVNKKIIEISHTGDDTFEKAILFVNIESSGLKPDELNRRAHNYITSLSPEKRRKPRLGRRRFPAAAMLLSMLAGIAAGIIIKMFI